MDHTCSTCRYYELPSDAFPCHECIDKSSWTIRIEDIEEPSEKINALFDSIVQITIGIGKLQSSVDELREELKQRRYDNG